MDFDLEAGEIHALVGENGAGKSTLMKVLTGIARRDAGEIRYLGQLFDPRDPKHALEMGIGIIHQELNMMDHLTVAENIFIGRESTRGVFLDRRARNRRAADLLARLGMNVDPTLGAVLLDMYRIRRASEVKVTTPADECRMRAEDEIRDLRERLVAHRASGETVKAQEVQKQIETRQSGLKETHTRMKAEEKGERARIRAAERASERKFHEMLRRGGEQEPSVDP